MVPRPQIFAYATSGHLYVVARDELDVPHVSRMKIIEGRSR
jgi:hypothetical protein